MVVNADSAIHILVIEDDRSQRELIRMALESGRDKVTLASVCDGEQAIAYLKKQGRYQQARRPDVILLDLKMPKMDGHGVLATIHQDPSLRLIPVVVLTTSTMASDRAKAYEMHANSYLVKPLDYSTFQVMIKDFKRYWSVLNKRLISPLAV